MLTLTEFLLARIAEDEQMWRLAETAELAFTTRSEGIAAVPPTKFSRRMVAECEVKRRIVEDCAEMVGYTEKSSAPILAAQVLRLLALPYADHPDYREEWKP